MIVSVADTHALLWYLADDKRLSAKVRDHIDDAGHKGNSVAVSSITLVEVIFLVERKRIEANQYQLVLQALTDTESVFVETPLTVKVAESLATINAVEVPDMPDRIIAATAVYHQVPLISRDRKITLSSVETLW